MNVEECTPGRSTATVSKPKKQVLILGRRNPLQVSSGIRRKKVGRLLPCYLRIMCNFKNNNFHLDLFALLNKMKTFLLQLKSKMGDNKRAVIETSLFSFHHLKQCILSRKGKHSI